MRMLYAVDLRDPDGWMIDEAARWATRCDATLDMVYVDPFGNYGAYVLDLKIHDMIEEQLRHERAQRADQLAELLAKIPAAHRGEAVVKKGAPVEAVVEMAPKYDAILVGSHRLKGLNRLLLGSVAEQIVRKAPVTTIALRAPEPEKA